MPQTTVGGSGITDTGPRQQWGRPSGWRYRAAGRVPPPLCLPLGGSPHSEASKHVGTSPRLQALPSIHGGPQTTGASLRPHGTADRRGLPQSTQDRRRLRPRGLKAQAPPLRQPGLSGLSWVPLETLGHSPTLRQQSGEGGRTWGSSAEVSGLHPWDFPGKSTGVGCHWHSFPI